MKHQFKRGMSMMLVLVMIVSLLSGLTVTAEAATYGYNWGQRGATATELSESAVSFYEENGITYEELSALSGAASTSAVPSSELYQTLKTLMVSNHSHITSYSEVKDLCQYTDCQNGGGAISSFYSGTSVGPTWDGSWNREHTWPNSKGLGGDDENDIMMLRPTSYSENTSRGNTAYGSGSSYYDPNEESGGAYNLHGDVARIALYVYTRWGNTSYMWGSSGVIESKEVLLEWMEEDPVDTWELGRNDVVEAITGTRNVYVDYPELAFLLFNEEIPADLTTPSGSSSKEYEITVTVNDSAMGTVSQSGENINAVPAEGYMVAGYTLLSGTAKVNRTGNAFTVKASSDCTIRINFEPKTEVLLTYLSSGEQLSEEVVYSGDAITLPDYTGALKEGYTFIGWSDVRVEDTDTVPVYYKSGEAYTVTGNTYLRALFSYVEESEGSTGAGVWTLVTDASQLEAGAQIVLAESASGFVSAPISGTTAYLSDAAVEFSADKTSIPTLPAGAQTFTLGGSEGAWTLRTDDGSLLGATAVKKLSYTGGTTTWTISVSGGDATIYNTNSSYGRFLYNVDWNRFTTYTSDSGEKMLLPQIYMLSDGEVAFYTTSFSTVKLSAHRCALCQLAEVNPIFQKHIHLRAGEP